MNLDDLIIRDAHISVSILRDTVDFGSELGREVYIDVLAFIPEGHLRGSSLDTTVNFGGQECLVTRYEGNFGIDGTETNFTYSIELKPKKYLLTVEEVDELQKFVASISRGWKELYLQPVEIDHWSKHVLPEEVFMNPVNLLEVE